jgi:hypothetical protein
MHGLIGAAGFVSMIVYCLRATFANFDIVDAVNERLPEPDRYSYLGWNPLKSLSLLDDYVRFFPEGDLIHRLRYLQMMAIFCGFFFLWGATHFWK